MKIKWLRRALRNLEILYTYISSDDADAARQTIVRIQDAVNQLAQYPFMGRYGRVEGTRELVIANTPYLVIYRVKEETVQIIRLLHASRKYPE
ncbi:MAG: type II toxin-antitoxin system RelE/ParE family toxin [Planktothrix rubescens PR222]|jgi:addiction module RelE/StbE family toxin